MIDLAFHGVLGYDSRESGDLNLVRHKKELVEACFYSPTAWPTLYSFWTGTLSF